MPSATRASKKSRRPRGRTARRRPMAPASSGAAANSVNRPSSTALSRVFEAIKPKPSCMMWSGVGVDCGCTVEILPHGLFADRDAPEEIEVEIVAEPRRGGNSDGSARRHLHLGRDDVAGPITLAGRDIAGQHEIRKRRERDVVGAADAGFEHASTPHRDAVGLRNIMDALGLAKAADAPELD